MYTVQSSSKVTVDHILDASCTHSGHVPHALAKRAWQLHKYCCSFLVRFCTCTMRCILCTFWTRLTHASDVTRARFRCVSHTFQMCLVHISDTSERYLGAELYRRRSPLFPYFDNYDPYWLQNYYDSYWLQNYKFSLYLLVCFLNKHCIPLQKKN